MGELMTSEKHRAKIAAKAAEAFKDHVLTREGETVWRCGVPGTMVMEFRLIFAPGAIIIYGDSPAEIVLKIHKHNHVGFLASATDVDYFAEKAQRSPHHDEVFMPGDAMAYLQQLSEETPAVASEIMENWHPRDNTVTADEWLGICLSAGIEEPDGCCDHADHIIWAHCAARKFVELYDARTEKAWRPMTRSTVIEDGALYAVREVRNGNVLCGFGGAQGDIELRLPGTIWRIVDRDVVNDGEAEIYGPIELPEVTS